MSAFAGYAISPETKGLLVKDVEIKYFYIFYIFFKVRSRKIRQSTLFMAKKAY